MDNVFYGAAVVLWLCGIVLAKGTTATIIACIFPLYAWYLVVEKAMLAGGFI